MGTCRLSRLLLHAAALALTATLAMTTSPARAASTGISVQEVQDELAALTPRVEAGQASVEDGYMLATLSRAADADQLHEINRLRALLDMQAGNFAEAREQLLLLAAEQDYAKRIWCRELAALLEACPDGLLPAATGGPAGDLTDPAVLARAMIDRAAAWLKQGLLAMNQAAQAARDPREDLDARATLLQQAYDALDTAEHLRPGIAIRYQKRCAVERIAVLKSRTEKMAARFDLDMKLMGNRQLPRPHYRLLLRGMVETLDAVMADLRTIRRSAMCSPEDFAGELDWTAADLASVRRMRDTIDAELAQVN